MDLHHFGDKTFIKSKTRKIPSVIWETQELLIGDIQETLKAI